MNEVAFMTTIFPMDEAYLYMFFHSLANQTFKEFDVIVVNDGYKGFDRFIREFKTLSIILLSSSASPAKNREYGLDYIKTKGYKVVVFGDSDDYFDANRIEVSVEALKNHDIVVNDLTLFSAEDGIYNRKYISNRIQDGSLIEIGFIREKNIFGLSNTAVVVAVIEKIQFDESLVAVDWYLYSSLLLRDKRAIFTNKTVTYYRQYINNTVGIGTNTLESFRRGISVKEKHYALLQNEDKAYADLYDNIRELKIESNLVSSFDKMSQLNIKAPLWWEEINYKEY